MINKDRPLPNAVEIEELILGTLLTYPDSLDEISSILKPETFYKTAHQIIYSAIANNFRENKPTDLWSITQRLRDEHKIDNIGGPLYLTQLSGKATTDSLIVYHTAIIKEKYVRREVIRIASEASRKAFDYEAIDVLNYLEGALFSLTGENMGNDPINLRTAYDDYTAYLEKLERREVQLTGVPSGLIGLDRLTLGWQPSDLIIVASRPSMGKTALALSFARNAAKMGKKVLFFSLEMSTRQLTARLLAGDSGIDSQQLRSGKDLNWTVIDNTISQDYNKNIFIDDTAGQSVFAIRSIIRKYKRKHNIDLVIVDYLQLAHGDERFIRFLPKYYGSIGTTLKNTAKDCDIPIILLSQLNREVEGRPNHMPKLSDLKESGDIEQDADLVLFPLRYEPFKELHNDPKYGDIRDKGHIDICKHRNGPTGMAYIKISGDKSRWEDWDKDSF